MKSLGDSQVVVCDINKEMLKVGKQKAQYLGYSEGKSCKPDSGSVMVGSPQAVAAAGLQCTLCSHAVYCSCACIVASVEFLLQ